MATTPTPADLAGTSPAGRAARAARLRTLASRGDLPPELRAEYDVLTNPGAWLEQLDRDAEREEVDELIAASRATPEPEPTVDDLLRESNRWLSIEERERGNRH